MKPIFYFILLLLISCSKNNLNKVCDVKDPVKELPWLANRVADAEANSRRIIISKVVLRDKKTDKLRKKVEGFKVEKQLGCYIGAYFNCSGENICGFGGVTGSRECYENFEILEEEVIYSNSN